MGIALGLGAALSWGLADYFAALASRRIGALRVVLGFHLAASAVLAVVVLSTGALDRVSWQDVPPFVLIGALGWSSYLAFYKSLAIGPISVVSPIVSAYAAVTVVLSVIVIGERLSAGETAAVTIAMSGVMLASADLKSGLRGGRALPLGLAFAVAAAVLIGGFVFGVAYYSDDLGWLAPIFLGRIFATLFLFGHLVHRGDWGLPDRGRKVFAVLGLLALLDTAGYVSFNLGVGREDTSIVATASAPYALVPIVMGVILLSERPTRPQWLGVALVVGGLVLLGLSS